MDADAILKEITQRLQPLADQYEDLPEDFDFSDGGNFDDTFWMGERYGRESLACEIMELIKKGVQ